MSYRVLVVDDDSDICEMIAQLLALEGLATDVAGNGQQALDKAHAQLPSLILLDMMMPVMDGWTFCARCRQDPVLAAIPVVILSAAPEARLKNVGAAAVLGKPFDYHELLTVVRAHCR